MNASDVTVAIPTLNRGTCVVATIRLLLDLKPRAASILIVDQTAQHPPDIRAQLEEWQQHGEIDWLRLPEPSIPQAMNEALLRCRTPLILFMDDDVLPSSGMIARHAEAHGDDTIWAVVGQILQPGETPSHQLRPADDLEFHFNHDEQAFITNVMAGNLSVKRVRAIEVGGFDENYIGSAHRFESDFALRLVAGGGLILFEPRASLQHLKIPTGGLRTFGDHRLSASPAHSSGDYYYALSHRQDFWRYAVARFRKNVLTRYHFRNPWTIPSKITGELRGLLQARALHRRGPALIRTAGR